jgi:hypothetical protein
MRISRQRRHSRVSKSHGMTAAKKKTGAMSPLASVASARDAQLT